MPARSTTPLRLTAPIYHLLREWQAQQPDPDVLNHRVLKAKLVDYLLDDRFIPSTDTDRRTSITQWIHEQVTDFIVFESLREVSRGLRNLIRKRSAHGRKDGTSIVHE